MKSLGTTSTSGNTQDVSKGSPCWSAPESNTFLQAPSTICCPQLQNLVYNSNQLPTHSSLLNSRSSTIGHLKYQLTPVFRQQNPLLGNTSPATVLPPHPQGQCRHTLCHDWTVLCISEHWLQFVLSAIFYELRMTFSLNNTAFPLQFCR